MENISGIRFGYLVVLRFHNMGNGTRPRPHWVCKCDCGKEHIASTNNLKKGNVKSCGCLVRDGKKKGNYRHGLHSTALYYSWKSMMSRCYNHKDIRYPRYGGRGITVCDRWHHIENFLSDIGHQPKRGMSLDRINNNGNYEPNNVRWANALAQANNRSTNKYHTINGITHTQAEWCEIYRVKQPTVCMRLKRGWSIEKALGIYLMQHVRNDAK